ncbi:MAG: Glyoxalase/bleomycin resistance protein/dioxygenase [Deltaproteobacteria bacterium]|nr:Glyoxalase/bleomycin resistance protein/dioxygenase [Deltaproteobacteria bacterium]
MPNPLVHWELMVSDVEKAKAFYRKVFDWSFTAAGPEYTLIECGAAPGGGLMLRPPNVRMSTLNSYFRVTDLDRTLRDAVEAGATVIVPRMEVPTVGWFAMFLDPEQIPIGVLQPVS